MTQGRQYCSECSYPTKTCICHAISPVKSQLTISILQDPKEAKHPKNTARLVALMLPQAKIYVGEEPADFNAVIDTVAQHKNTLLIYPCESAIDINRYVKPFHQPTHLILIDGTWRKAKKIWLNNPWLHRLNAAKLNLDGQSLYSIRKSSIAQSLSTLEALAYSLNSIEQCPIEPFAKVLAAMQAPWHDNRFKAL